jgi:alkylation response protein AidB-like acyl-CoA dehydrogenase
VNTSGNPLREEGLEEIAMISRSALEFAKGMGGVARARKVRDQWPKTDADAWRHITEMGWFGALVPESQGGLGLDARALAALGEAIGSVLMLEPVVPAIAGAYLLAHAGVGAHTLLQATLEGNCRPGLAYARRAAGGLRVTVADIGERTTLVVAAQDDSRIGLIDLGAAGVTRVDHECVDGSTLSDVTVTLDVWRNGESLTVDADAFAFAIDLMLLGDAAQLVGAMDSALALAVEYLKTRSQFGAPIGSFQALQHRAASAYVDIAGSRALLGEAARAFSVPAKRRRAAAAVKARASDAAMRVMNACVQFHGAIGFADEHDIGLFYRRAMVLTARGGNASEQYDRYAALSAEEAAV